MSKPFVIDQVSWHTSTPGNVETRDQIVRRFFIVADFLQRNSLVRKALVNRIEDIGDDFTISSDDLSEEGLGVMKAAYDKWLQKVDNGTDPGDVSMLERALRQIRQN